MLRMHGMRLALAGGNQRPGPAILYFLAGSALALWSWQTVSRFRASSLEDLVFAGKPDPPGWTVALIFTPKECPSRMDLVERLNRAAGTEVSVRGIMLVDPRRFPGWRDAAVANGITFPVRAESPAAAAQALEPLGGLPTPVLAVYDSAHRLRLVTDLASGESVDRLLAQITSNASGASPSPEPAP